MICNRKKKKYQIRESDSNNPVEELFESGSYKPFKAAITLIYKLKNIEK